MIRVGLAGYGLAGKVFHGMLVKATPGMEVRAISTANPDRQAQARKDFPKARICPGYEELIGAGDLDLVVLGTPHDGHCAQALAAFEKGLHVVTDKIMCLSVAEADSMIAASQRAGKLLSVFHNRRWDSDFLTLRQVLDQGLIGDPVVIESSVVRGGPDMEPAPALDTRPWRARSDKGGGPFRDWGAHLMDQALILGGGLPYSVFCQLEHRRPKFDLETLATCSMEFASSRGKPGFRIRVESGGHSWIPRPRWYVQGTLGTLVMEGLDPQEDWLKKGEVVSGTDKAKFPGVHAGFKTAKGSFSVDCSPGTYAAYYQNIADVLAKKDKLAVTPESCREVLRVYEAAYESARTGQVVPLREGPSC